MGTPLAAGFPGDDPSTPRRWYRRPGWLAVIALVLIAAVIAAIAVAIGGGEDTAAPPPASSSAANPNPPSTGEGGYLPDTADRFGQQIRVPRDPAGLPLPQSPVRPARGPDVAASGTQWQKVYGFGTAVFSTSDGPTSISADGLAQGIAHTPQGSVIAASQIIARGYYGTPAVRQRVLAEQVIGPDTAKQMLLDLELPARQYAVARHARVDPQYSDTFSRVSLAVGPKPSSDYPSGEFYGVTTMTMVWDAGQWKWRIPDEGFTTATGDTQVESVTGWTQW